jgi:hypothetical protein
LKEVVVTETRAGKVLERVSSAPHSAHPAASATSAELKLEIYKKQILMLTAELDQLKTRI